MSPPSPRQRDPGSPAPWDDLSVFPAKPEGVDYAYLRRPTVRGEEPVVTASSPDELRALVASGVGGLLVAVPGRDRLVPPAFARELWPAIAEREERLRRAERKSAVISFGVFGVIAAYSLATRDVFFPFVVLFFVVFGLVPVVQAVAGEVARRVRDGSSRRFEDGARRVMFGYWLGTRSDLATRVVVFMLGSLYVLQVLHDVGSLGLWRALERQFVSVGPATIEAAALVKDRVRDGEVWRLLTGGLLHGSFLHIFFNASAFRNVGQVVEALCGWPVLLLTFLVSVVAGSVASTLLLPGTDSVGASGGVMGLVGFLLVAAVRHRRFLPPGLARSIAGSVVFVAAIGIVAWRLIDNYAHLGGLLAGAALAVLLASDRAKLGRGLVAGPVRWAGVFSAAVLGVGAVFAATRLMAAG